MQAVYQSMGKDQLIMLTSKEGCGGGTKTTSILTKLSAVFVKAPGQQMFLSQ